MADYVLSVPRDTSLELTLNNGGSAQADPIPVASIGGGSPLSAWWWVDPATASASPDGSPGNPFPTIEAALAAAVLASITALTLEVVAGALTPAIDQQDVPNLAIVGAGVGLSEWPSVTWTPHPAGSSTLELSNLTISGSLTVVEGAGTNSLRLDNVSMAGLVGPATTVDLVARNSTCTSQAGANSVRLYSCPLWGLTGDVADSFHAWDSHLVDMTGEVTGAVRLTACDIDGGALVCGGYEGWACRGAPASLTSNGITWVDPLSWQWLNVSTVLTLNSPAQVFARPAQATISVAVPALAAGELGYVDVSTVGSDLEGLIGGAGQIVSFNPLDDVEAAGAGNGGPLYARASALDTIRVAFLGTTTAHAVDFLFWLN